jgi:hypothetical protein
MIDSLTLVGKTERQTVLKHDYWGSVRLKLVGYTKARISLPLTVCDCALEGSLQSISSLVPGSSRWGLSRNPLVSLKRRNEFF